MLSTALPVLGTWRPQPATVRLWQAQGERSRQGFGAKPIGLRAENSKRYWATSIVLPLDVGAHVLQFEPRACQVGSLHLPTSLRFSSPCPLLGFVYVRPAGTRALRPAVGPTA
jgi:hypothetical protein